MQEKPGYAMIVLGLETSCDETAAALVHRDEHGIGHVLSNCVYSQIEDHAEFGGVVPEIAARAHVNIIDGIIKQAMKEADVRLDQVDGIAVTSGPGLIGGVLVGLMTAKAIASYTKKPLLAINHLEGHALTARLTQAIQFPYLLLLVSGGHTQILLVKGVGKYERWGTTIDDALGEAFDKTAKLLGLPYPGGPEVEKAALKGDADRFDLPRSLKGRPGCDFSFSGLKTAVRRAAEKIMPVSQRDVNDLCASFQKAATESIADRLEHALVEYVDRFPDFETRHLVIAGGVAANSAIRAVLEKAGQKHSMKLVAPPHELCTDNGAMIAWAGAERLVLGLTDPLSVGARARWPLDENAVPKLGKSTSKHGARA